MAYIDPKIVQSPKGRVKNLNVIFDGGEGSYSVAHMDWDGNAAVGVRWNGGATEGLGNPTRLRPWSRPALTGVGSEKTKKTGDAGQWSGPGNPVSP